MLSTGMMVRPTGHVPSDVGKPWEHVRCTCGDLLVDPPHPRCRQCDRPRPCGERRWRVCGENWPGCGPYCPECVERGERTTHSHYGKPVLVGDTVKRRGSAERGIVRGIDERWRVTVAWEGGEESVVASHEVRRIVTEKRETARPA